jgi:hypothetical protein
VCVWHKNKLPKPPSSVVVHIVARITCIRFYLRHEINCEKPPTKYANFILSKAGEDFLSQLFFTCETSIDISSRVTVHNSTNHMTHYGWSRTWSIILIGSGHVQTWAFRLYITVWRNRAELFWRRGLVLDKTANWLVTVRHQLFAVPGERFPCLFGSTRRSQQQKHVGTCSSGERQCALENRQQVRTVRAANRTERPSHNTVHPDLQIRVMLKLLCCEGMLKSGRDLKLSLLLALRDSVAHVQVYT